MADFVWTPTAEVLERANVTRLMRAHAIDDYWELVRRSHEDPEWFWPAAVADMGIEFSVPWEQLMDDSQGAEWTRWFCGGRLNIASNCVHRHATGPRAHEAAVVFIGEDGARYAITFAELSLQVTRFAEGLLALDVREGDRVALYLPMSPEAAIVSYACAHVGAIQVPIFSGFAAQALAERLADAEPRVVVTADGSLRRGRILRMKEVVDEALEHVPSVEHVIVWPRLERADTPMDSERDLWWDDALREMEGTLPPAQVESETPFMVIYTSGTTGKPKGVVHVQGGLLVSLTREVCYHADVRAGDVIHYVSDMGWIMGPWAVIGGHAMGATLLLSEGAPDWPPDRLWRIVESERTTILGVAPTLIRSLVHCGADIVEQRDLSSLRILVTSGEPWNKEPYRWFHRHVGKNRLPIINCSGGTEVGACFLAPAPVVPIKACSLGGPALGMAVDVVNEMGGSLRGHVGELVCRRPFPAMTRGFWRDPDRYLRAYWRRFPGIWTHGDWASVDEDGYWYLHGRSDDTLNIAGKRLGPAEIESAVVSNASVAEAAAVGIPHETKGEVAWVFCTLAPGTDASDELAQQLADEVASVLGKPFRPDRIVFVAALPKTRTAKVVRRAIRAIAMGQDPGDLSSVENPEVLQEIASARPGLHSCMQPRHGEA